jgi:hypothetical protein
MSDHTRFTIRDAGESIKETAGKIGSSILHIMNTVVKFW